MARCKRCGAFFDYDKKEGVCPRCCFYNRPPGSPHHDDEWLSTYNIEENTYELPKQSMQFDEEPKKIWHRRRPEEKRRYTSEKDCHTEGSHVHVDKKKKQSYKKREEPEEKKRFRPLLILLVIAVIAYAAMFIYHRIPHTPTPKRPEDRTPVREFNVEELSRQELMDGVTIGDMAFSTDDQGAVVLFEEGELPEIPPGEMCVGIHLTDNESEIGYSGIHWKRPYVYDGTYYRELVDGLLMGGKGLDVKMGTDFMLTYLSSSRDFDGMAVYFVDKNAESITLCIPTQTIENDDVVTTGVTEIRLPVKHKEQEGGTAVE